MDQVSFFNFLKETIEIEDMSLEHGWFQKTKHFWKPVSWQGFAFLGGYFIFVFSVFAKISNNKSSLDATILSFVPFFVLASIVCIGIIFVTEEKTQASIS